MGESSTFLSRSYSHQSPKSSESREEDPIRKALTSSVSLGRFMSETLAWDKWSAFSQNRYIEEAEKYSKPGSVAEKKAYFEAHYQKLAAKKAAALLELEQQCPAVDNVSSVRKTNENDDNSAAEMALAQKRGEGAKITEIHGVNTLCSIDTSWKTLPRERHTEGALTEEAEVATGQPPYADENVKPLSNQQMDVEIHDVQRMKATVEKASRLGGSVAEKKSFLEAHYKKIAAKKAAAADNSSLGNRTNENDDNSASLIEPAQESSEGAKIPKMHGENTINTGALFSVDPNQHTLLEERGTEGTQTEEVELSIGQLSSTEKGVKPYSTNQMDVSTHDEQDEMEIQKASSDSAPTNKIEDAFSSGKPSSNECGSNECGSNSRSSIRPKAPISRTKLDHTETPVTKKRSTQSLEKKISAARTEQAKRARGRPLFTENDIKPLRNHHRDVKAHVEKGRKATIENPSASGASATSDKNEDACSSRKPSSKNHGSKSGSSVKPNMPTCPRKLDHTGTPINMKRPTQSLEKKRPNVHAVHMSMNFTSRAFDASKTSSLVSKRIVDSRLHKSTVGTSAVSSSQQTLLRSSVGGISHLRVTPGLGKNRDEKPKPVCQSKVKSTTLLRSFCLRSDERAAKRNEFFEKLEQQKLSSEAEKELCKSKQKEKAKGVSNAVHQSVPSLAEANFRSSTVSASIATQKLPAQSYFQQIKKRLASEARDNNSRPPWRFSKKTDSALGI